MTPTPSPGRAGRKRRSNTGRCRVQRVESAVTLGQAVEDEIETEIELVGEVVTGLQVVGPSHLDHRRIRTRCHQFHDGLGDVSHRVRSLKGECRLLEGEPVDVAVDECIGVGGQLEGEPGMPQARQNRVVMTKGRGPRCGARLQQTDLPRNAP
jgi:hypothetical protein